MKNGVEIKKHGTDQYTTYTIYILLRSNPCRQHSKVLYRWEVTRRGKRRSEEKEVGFSSVSLFLARILKAVTQGGTTGIENQTRRKTQGAGIVKGWEEKRDHGRIPDTFT